MNKESKKETFAADTSGRSAADWIRALLALLFGLAVAHFGVTLFLLPRIALDHGSLIITILSIQVVFLCVPFIWIEFLLSRHFK